MKTIYDFTDYRSYLKHRIAILAPAKGIKNALAEAARCHPSYISTTLKGTTDLTPDHAAGLSRHFKLDLAATEYFLLLVHLARASTPYLREFIELRMASLRKEAADLDRRLSMKPMAASDASAFYYSSWVNAAIHVALSVEELRTAKALAQRFGIGAKEAEECLRNLGKHGLAENRGEKRYLKHTQVHLSPDSPFIFAHHSHWRTRSVLNVLKRDPSSLHYSGIHTLSESAALELRTRLEDLIVEVTELVKSSKEERIQCLNLDWFEV